MSFAAFANRARPDRQPFRSDIEGLRGIAVSLVVAFHVGLPGFRGGFVGVDVFFVISGHLINRSLWLEATRSGTISLSTFYARRVRRLIPALVFMLAATTLLALALLPPLDVPRVATSIRTAALYVSNEHFRLLSSDYFSGAVRSDPVLHTWPLSVEEQFYFVWPCLLLLVWHFGSATQPRIRRPRWAFVLIATCSFVATCALGDSSRNAVFFGAPFRGWEFAVGALASTFKHSGSSRSTARLDVAFALSLLGACAIAYAATQFSSATQFPGVASLLPVVGTALLLALGQLDGIAPHLISRALASRPVVWIGRRSYGWYLWHWPLLVFSAAWFAQNTLILRLSAAAVALVLAFVQLRIYRESNSHDEADIHRFISGYRRWNCCEPFHSRCEHGAQRVGTPHT